MFRKYILAVAALVAIVMPAAHAASDTLVWKVRSQYPYQVYLEFYSQDNNHSWPGGGNAYILEDSRFHTYRLNCRSGERICYGAWVTTDDSIYWGVGRYGDNRCSNCCYVCGAGSTESITLTR